MTGHLRPKCIGENSGFVDYKNNDCASQNATRTRKTSQTDMSHQRNQQDRRVHLSLSPASGSSSRSPPRSKSDHGSMRVNDNDGSHSGEDDKVPPLIMTRKVPTRKYGLVQFQNNHYLGAGALATRKWSAPPLGCYRRKRYFLFELSNFVCFF